jgi:hypothetical protein
MVYRSDNGNGSEYGVRDLVKIDYDGSSETELVLYELLRFRLA